MKNINNKELTKADSIASSQPSWYKNEDWMDDLDRQDMEAMPRQWAYLIQTGKSSPTSFSREELIEISKHWLTPEEIEEQKASEF